ncbi:MAG: molybdopterin-dependent oxidoreductase [Coriobacteriaceae bacterium]|nr:molybdopterin-dependent oxidoreductase [Coriobacteriaceae bacterium]
MLLKKDISRRGFVQMGLFTTAAAAMSGTVASHLQEVEPAEAAEAGEEQQIRTICRACLNNCGIIAHVRDGRVVKLEGDPGDPMNKGAACAKGLAGIQALYNPNRIKYPMKRVGERGVNEWERLSWEEAINEIADVLWEHYQKEGVKSLVLSTGGGGNPQFFSPARFLTVWGGGNFFEPGCAQCYLPRNHMEPCLNGTADTSLADGPVTEVYLPDCQTQVYVMWGVGPSTHGIGSTGRIVTELRSNGMKSVVIDPRMTPDAARADVWLPIRPGTDVALMLAWIRYIIEHEAWNEEFCREWTNLPFLVNSKTGLTYRANELGLGSKDEYVVYDKKSKSVKAMPYPYDKSLDPAMFGEYELPDGTKARTAFQHLKEQCDEWTLEKAAEVCWLQADKIEEAINLYIDGTPHGGISLGVATDQARNSAQAAQASAILDILRGAIRTPGAIVQNRPCFVEPCNYVVMPFGLHGPHPLEMPEKEVNARLGYTEHKGLGHWMASHIPTVLKAIETGEPYRPRVWMERSGNKLAMIGNATRIYNAMLTTDMNVHMYMHWTTTSVCLADYVLPTAEWLETNYAQDRLNTYAIRRACTQLYEAVDECMHWSWMAAALADRGHERAKMSFDPKVCGDFYGTYWRTYEEYMDFVGYFVGSNYYDTKKWDWATFDAQAPSEYQTIQEYADKSYDSHLDPDPDNDGKPVGFNTTSKRCEPYFDGNILLGNTGAIDGTGSMEPATDVYPLSDNYNPLPYYLEPFETPVEGEENYDPAYPYALTQGRLPAFHHGTLRNVPYTREIYPYPETWINPETAAEIGVEDGDWLWLESKRGRTQGRCRITKSVAPKVIYQERFWNPELLDSDDPNRAWQCFNINLLTQNNDECPFNDVYGTYTLRGITINITKADAPPEGCWLEAKDFTPWLPEYSENTGGGNAVYAA